SANPNVRNFRQLYRCSSRTSREGCDCPRGVRSGTLVITSSTCGGEAKRVEKLRYIHRNPVRRGLVARPEDWKWSSFRHYATGVEGVVEIESERTAMKRERMGIVPLVRESQNPRPVAQKRATRTGYPQD